jgi:magnesium-protoporphyrin O-methyltransferase
MFGDKTARRDLDRYRRKGPSKPTRRLLAMLREQGVSGASVLDIGGGVGAIQHELLDSGAAHAVGVDASPAYLRAARQEGERRGHLDRMSTRHGDFVQVAEDVPDADVVTLDRVICCYPDMEALVGASAERARRVYGLVHPRDRWWTRAGVAAGNLALRLARKQFRAYVHPVGAVDAVAGADGLTLRSRESVGAVWQVAVYVRGASGMSATTSG